MGVLNSGCLGFGLRVLNPKWGFGFWGVGSVSGLNGLGGGLGASGLETLNLWKACQHPVQRSTSPQPLNPALK